MPIATATTRAMTRASWCARTNARTRGTASRLAASVTPAVSGLGLGLAGSDCEEEARRGPLRGESRRGASATPAVSGLVLGLAGSDCEEELAWAIQAGLSSLET